MDTYPHKFDVPNTSGVYEAHGLIYEPPRATDYMYKASSTNATAGAFPADLSLRDQISGILYQGDIGSCVSNAIAQYIKMVSGTTWISRLFHYYVTRLMQGDTIVGSKGLSVEHAMQCIKRYGVCDEGVWTYDTSGASDAKANQMPDINAFRESYNNIPIHLRNFKYEYFPINGDRSTLTAVKDWLNTNKRPLLICMSITRDTCIQLEIVKTKYIRIPVNRFMVNHMVVLVGYDDNQIIEPGDRDGAGYVTLINSWSYYFGDKGAFCISYDHFCRKDLVYCIVGMSFQW